MLDETELSPEIRDQIYRPSAEEQEKNITVEMAPPQGFGRQILASSEDFEGYTDGDHVSIELEDTD